MLTRHIAYCLVLTALTAAPAMAQTKPDAQTKPEAQTPAAQAKPAAEAGGIHFITSQSPDQWRGSKLIGVSVVGPDEKKIGAISEVLVDHSGNAQAVVIGIGGFLGIGEKDVAVPFKTLKWVSHEEAAKTVASKAPPQPGSASKLYNYAGPNPPPAAAPGGTMSRASAPAAKPATDATLGYPDHAVVSMTKDELKKAPDFRYAGASAAMNVPPRAK
jgi:PRC-barrel domain